VNYGFVLVKRFGRTRAVAAGNSSNGYEKCRKHPLLLLF